MKLLDGNTGVNLHDFELDNSFKIWNQNHKQQEKKIDN